VRALFSPLFALSAWSDSASVVANATTEGADLASVRKVGVGSARHCGGGHDRWGRSSGFCLLVRRELLMRGYIPSTPNIGTP
jgi:hypothetical protein